MFGCIVAGRPVQTNAQECAPGKFVFTLGDASAAPINHIVIFLTGLLPPGFGATIYAGIDASTWKFLGVLTNEKPSAIFKVSSPSSSPSVQIVGISVEPLETLAAALAANNQIVPATRNNSTAPTDAGTVIQRVAESLFNYVASFARPIAGLCLEDPNEPLVPLKSLQEWYQGTLRKLSTDPAGTIAKFSS